MSVARGFDRTIKFRPKVAGVDTGTAGAVDAGSLDTRTTVTPVTPARIQGYGGNLTGIRGMSQQQIDDAIARESFLEQLALMGLGDMPSGYMRGADDALVDAVAEEISGRDQIVSSSGGGGNRRDLTALASFIGESIGDVTERYSGLSEQLEARRAVAAARIAEANEAARASLAGVDPLAGFNYNVPIEELPMAAGTEYLRRMGASTAPVEAARALGRQLVMAQVGSGQRFAEAIAASQEADRLARLASIEEAGARGLSALEMNALAMQGGIDKAADAERRALEQTLLEAQLKYGV